MECVNSAHAPKALGRKNRTQPAIYAELHQRDWAIAIRGLLALPWAGTADQGDRLFRSVGAPLEDRNLRCAPVNIASLSKYSIIAVAEETLWIKVGGPETSRLQRSSRVGNSINFPVRK